MDSADPPHRSVNILQSGPDTGPPGGEEMTGHISIWRDFAGRIGPPIFAATLVACLLQRVYDPLHIILLVVGAGMIWVGHRSEYHRG
jgi:hypothetical protein